MKGMMITSSFFLSFLSRLALGYKVEDPLPLGFVVHSVYIDKDS